MSADSELLIKIKTILESQGIDAAKAKLGELINTTNAAGLSEATANKERDKSADKSEKTAKAILAMNNAMAGGMGPFRAAITVANQLGGSFATMAFKAAAVGAAMTIGWKVGTALREWVTGAKEVEGEMDRIKKASDDLRDRVLKLNDIRLDALKKEAQDITDGFSNAINKAERLKRLTDLREDAELASNLAAVNLSFHKGDINENERDRLELKYQHESEQRKNKSEEKRINTEESLSNSRVAQARGKLGGLSRKAGMAQQDYEQAIITAKELGIENPEDLISGGKQSPEYQAAFQKAQTDLKTAREYLGPDGKPIQSSINHAQKKFDSVSDLPDLKLLADASKKDLEAYRPIYQQTTEAESVKQEQLDTEKSVLLENAYTSRDKYQAGNQVIVNKISSDFSKAVEETTPGREKARDSGQMIIDSIGLNPSPVRDNAGLPMSQGAQEGYDAVRANRARSAIEKATNSAYRGGDVNAIVDELVQALDNVGARLAGAVHKEDLVPVLTAVKNLQSQSTVSKGAE